MKKLLLILFTGLLVFNSFSQDDYDIYLSKSFDGTTFNNEIMLMDSAGVPSAIQHPNGKVIVVFQNFKGGSSSPNYDKIAVRISNDTGVSWTPRTMINVTGYPGVSTRIFDPTITITTDSMYRLFFTYCPPNMTSMLDSNCDTYSALSADGVNYVFDTGYRVVVSNKAVIDPAVVYYGSTWHFYSPAGAPQIGARHATSSDGLNFTIVDTVGAGDNSKNWTGNAIDNGANIRFYGYSDPAHNKNVWWNTSVDGFNWTGYTWTNLFGNDPGMVKLNTGQYFAFVVTDSNTTILTSTGIDNNSIPEKLTIFPNPTSEKLMVNLTTKINSIEIISMDGKMMKQQVNENKNTLEVNCDNLKPGIYFIRIYANKKVYQEKFIKQ